MAAGMMAAPMRRLGRAVDRFRGKYRPPHTRHIDIGDLPTVPDFSREHLLGLEQDAPLGQLDVPAAMPAKDLPLSADDLVLLAERGSEVRLWPVLLLRRYHVVNDVVGGHSMVVTFCPRCFSGVAFGAQLGDRLLKFEVFGLYQGTMVMRDTETGTVWTPFDGRAVAGPLVGRQLAIEPLQMTTLGEAIAHHPDATAPAVPMTPKPGARGPGEGRQDDRLRLVVRTWDDRLPARTLVLGVEANGQSRAYALDAARPGPVVAQDQVGRTPVVLMAAGGGWPLAYDRTVDGEVLEFSAEGDRVSTLR